MSSKHKVKIENNSSNSVNVEAEMRDGFPSLSISSGGQTTSFSAKDLESIRDLSSMLNKFLEDSYDMTGRYYVGKIDDLFITRYTDNRMIVTMIDTPPKMLTIDEAITLNKLHNAKIWARLVVSGNKSKATPFYLTHVGDTDIFSNIPVEILQQKGIDDIACRYVSHQSHFIDWSSVSMNLVKDIKIEL